MLCLKLVEYVEKSACFQVFNFLYFDFLRNLPMILNWVKAQKPGVMGVNIITSDFVELVDFAATVIALNNLLLEEDESAT